MHEISGRACGWKGGVSNFQKPFGKSEVRFVAPKHRLVFHVKGGNNGKGMGEKGGVG